MVHYNLQYFFLDTVHRLYVNKITMFRKLDLLKTEEDPASET
jgi:hypothetical protein